MSENTEGTTVNNLYAAAYEALIPEELANSYEAVTDPIMRAEVLAPSLPKALEILFQHRAPESIEVLSLQLEIKECDLMREKPVLQLHTGEIPIEEVATDEIVIEETEKEDV